MPLVAFFFFSIASISAAQDIQQRFDFNIESKKLGGAISELHKATGVRLWYDYALAERAGIKPVVGQYTIVEALDLMLRDSGLVGGLTESGMIVITQINGESQSREDSMASGNIKKTLLASAAALMFGANSGQAFAQEVDRTESSKDEIVVTSSRRVEKLQDVPMAVTAVDPQEFTGVGLTNLDELISYTPGVSVDNGAGFGGPVGAKILARGVAQLGDLNDTSTVGIYLDGVPISSNSPWGLGGRFAFDGLLEDLERIEFLKGPQGTLYGATSVGGAVQYITRKPSLDEFRGRVSADVSSTKDGGVNYIHSGRISAPIVAEKLGITLSGFYQENGGVVDRVEVGTGALIEEDTDDYTRYGAAADVFFRVTEDLSMRLRASRQEYEFDGLSVIGIDPVSREPTYGAQRGDDLGGISVQRTLSIQQRLSIIFRTPYLNRFQRIPKATLYEVQIS